MRCAAEMSAMTTLPDGFGPIRSPIMPPASATGAINNTATIAGQAGGLTSGLTVNERLAAVTAALPRANKLSGTR